MKCQEFAHLYQDLIDGTLSAAQQRALRTHRQECPSCALKYDTCMAIIKALQGIGAPPPREDFAERVIKVATGSEQRVLPWGKWMLPAALAASIVVTILVIVQMDPKPVMKDSVVMLHNDEAQVVRISIESGRDIAKATIEIDLTENLEIEGSSKSKSLKWETELRKGTNIINLPILPTANGEGLITTRIMLGGEEKSVRIRTRSEPFNEAWRGPPYYLSA